MLLIKNDQFHSRNPCHIEAKFRTIPIHLTMLLDILFQVLFWTNSYVQVMLCTNWFRPRFLDQSLTDGWNYPYTHRDDSSNQDCVVVSTDFIIWKSPSSFVWFICVIKNLTRLSITYSIEFANFQLINIPSFYIFKEEK